MGFVWDSAVNLTSFPVLFQSLQWTRCMHGKFSQTQVGSVLYVHLLLTYSPNLSGKQNQTKSRRLSCVFLIKLFSSNEISTGCFFFFFFYFAGKIQVLKILLIIMPKFSYSFEYHYKSRN